MNDFDTKDYDTDIHGKKYNKLAMLAIIFLAAFAGGIMQTSLGTALPTLMKSFDIDLNTAQQATTWFLLANGITVPLSAFLVNRFSVKWLHVVGYAMMLLGLGMTILTPSNSSSWWIFVVGRVITAFAFGIIMPLMQIVILNVFPAKKRGLAMGMTGLVVGMSPAIGPTLTGWILNKDHTILGMTLSNNWESIFYLPIAIVLIAFILSPFVIKDVMPTKKIKLDVLSLILSAVGFGLFLWGFTNVGTDGWYSMGTVSLPIIVGTLVLIWFVWRQLHLEKPFLDVRVFKSSRFTITTFGVIMSMMAMYGVEMMLPTYLQNVHGMTPLDSGITLLPGALMMGILSPVAGILYQKIGIKYTAIIGFTLLAAGTLPFLWLSPSTKDGLITILYTIRMMGISLALMPLTTAAMAALPDEKSTDGTAANNTARQISSSVVVAILTSVTTSVINNHKPAIGLKTSNPLSYASQYINASMDGFKVAFAIGLGFAVVGLLITILFVKNDRNSKDTEEG